MSLNDLGLIYSAQDGFALDEQGRDLVLRCDGIEHDEEPLRVAVFFLGGEIWVQVDEFDFLLDYFVHLVVMAGSIGSTDGR